MRHLLVLLLPAAVAMSLWACSQMPDHIPDAEEPDIPAPAAGFIGIQLMDSEATQTRADDTHREYNDRYEYFEWFNKGTADERAIINSADNNRVLFFNSDFSFFGSYGLTKPTAVTSTSNIYVAQTPLEKDDVAYALVVLNADKTRLDELETKLDALADKTSAVELVLSHLFEVDTDDPESLAMAEDVDKKKYFTMTSTVYCDEDTNQVTVLTPLSGQIFFESEEEALRSENLTTFYVERVLAKFTLLISNKDGDKRFNEYDAPIIVNGANKLKVRQEYAPADGLAKDVMTDWKINVVNWGLNGLEKNTYLIKRLLEPSAGSYPWTINGNFYTGWNAPNLYRSYWGVDENYTEGFYPDQYRQALDVEGVEAATGNNIYSGDYAEADGLKRKEYTLIYKPYNAYQDLTENKYTLENTFDPVVLSEQDLSTKPWLRCGTHIIMTAQFIIDEIDKDIDLTGNQPGFITGVKDKYFSNGMYWSEKALKEQAVATLMTNIYYNKKGDEIKNVIGSGSVDFINTDEHPLDDDAPISASIDGGERKVLEHKDLATNADTYFEFAPAFIKGGDGWVTLKKKDNVTLYARYVNKESGTVDEQELSEEQIVSYIYRFTNLAKHYKDGCMYYALPVRHNLESISFRNDPVTDVRTGDYGVVRNTWYRLTITSIQVPGTPVDDPDQPIIPNPEPDDKSLGVEVEVIPWRTVEIEVDQLH